MCLENSGLDSDTASTGLSDEVFVKAVGFRRRGGLIKTRAAPFTAISVESELRHDEKRASCIEEAEVHFARVVGEDAEIRNLVEQVGGGGFGITLGDAEQNEKSLCDHAGDLIVDRDTGSRDTLYHCPHGRTLTGKMELDMMIETYAYARAGLLGNPSDGYYGKTIAFLVRNFRARVLLYPSARLEIKAGKADMPVFESMDDLYRSTKWRGYYGGIRIIQALIVRFLDYCKTENIPIEERNFTLEYESTIPLRLGMGGSSAIITAALRALCQYFEVAIPLPIQAKLALETETVELGVPAGPQDRVIQALEGVVFMNFQRALMESRGYGEYERLDAELMPSLYLAYRTSLSEGTEVFHNNIRERWRSGDPEIVTAMQTWASYAEQGRDMLVSGDHAGLDELIDANYDLRAKIYKIDAGNQEMIGLARSTGASANFAGSGGAITGIYRGEAMFNDLVRVMSAKQIAVVKPTISPRVAK
jgi:glucuronokinase